MAKKTLTSLRKDIDAIDKKILDLLNRRSKVALEVGKIKEKSSKDYYVPTRERDHLERLKKANKGPFPDHALQSVFKEIFSASLALQSPFKVGYLGPAATFTHMASLKHFGRSTEMIPMPTIRKVFQDVEGGRLDYGVVPIENSMEGVVNLTLDQFLDSSLKINAEVYLPISHHLMVKKGGLGNIRKIYSHPHATAQCRQWLEEHLPSIPVTDESSTAKAAQRSAEEPYAAAIASEYAAELYNLKIVNKNIEDYAKNFTRFLVISNEESKKTTKDKTSLLFSVKDSPGILYKILEPFSKAKINLSKIESRPMKKKIWQYIFFLDIEGHVKEPRIARALKSLEKQCILMKVLGSYPKSH